ncbi:DNA directed RNA polymerase, 7 kDa subunit [Hibiscus syriacus]|uniref:DNA directed RNA polymerase, 7 kDa subunit n=1 Tax=Hibiscus syriacus TaxID=106335 RepID=A0A6A2XCQ1_HIBSY|nr:DNA directed RNA polymerase, 7 kDa subunit [Hibiscus syriacus]
MSSPIPMAKTIPATDIIIDFGKHKGKMLGTLPSNYLRWVSKNLRAGDNERWAKLADQVLEDPIYRDRIEWEFAENVLNGNNAKGRAGNSVSLLLEMSERFGWDNEDKEGWSRVKFELLGTSNGGRLPRIGVNNGRNREAKQAKSGDGEKRRRLKKQEESVRLERSKGPETVEIFNPFPGRQALLNKMMNKHQKLQPLFSK